MTDRLTSLLTALEVAALLGIRPKRVYELPIPRVRLGTKTIRWRMKDIQTYVDQHIIPAITAPPPAPSTASWAQPSKKPTKTPSRPAPTLPSRAKDATRDLVDEEDDGTFFF